MILGIIKEDRMKTIVYTLNQKPANLVIMEGDDVRTLSLLAQYEWAIGRPSSDTKPDIEINSPIVGRQHGKIQCISGEWYYVDLGSVNGTYHNGEKIKLNDNKVSDAVKLHNGDILRIDSRNLDSPDKRGVFMLFSTDNIGKKWNKIELTKNETYFGRSEESCDVVLPLPYISRRHTVIRKRDTGYFVEDCESLAGTWLNNSIVREEKLLREKDVIEICDCRLIFTSNNIIYNIPSNVNARIDEEEPEPIVLKADIKTRKVPNNTGHGEKELIRDIKVEVCEGTLVALIGGSGAGKSTVMNCLNGMDTEGMVGTVEYKGVDLLKYFDRMKYLIGSVPQMETFHESLTVEQELAHAAKHRLPGDTSKSEIMNRVDHTLRQLDIESIRKNRISKCCGGERRRVNIGIELVADRQLLCLDEPDAGLDQGNKRRLFETLHDLAHKENKSILAIIHDVTDIDLFDKVIILNKVADVGRLAFSGTPEEARKHFGVEIKDIYQLMAKNPEKYVYNAE